MTSPDRNPEAGDPLTALPGFALRRAAQAMMGDLASRLAAIDLRISESSVLQVIANRTDLTSSEIGKVLDIQRANMVPLLGRLEAAGLIRRQPLDRKSQAVILTEAGFELLDAVHDVVAQFEQHLMDRIPAEHRPHFLPALLALIG